MGYATYAVDRTKPTSRQYQTIHALSKQAGIPYDPPAERAEAQALIKRLMSEPEAVKAEVDAARAQQRENQRRIEAELDAWRAKRELTPEELEAKAKLEAERKAKWELDDSLRRKNIQAKQANCGHGDTRSEQSGGDGPWVTICNECGKVVG